jgi:hypothetical protein
MPIFAARTFWLTPIFTKRNARCRNHSFVSATRPTVTSGHAGSHAKSNALWPSMSSYNNILTSAQTQFILRTRKCHAEESHAQDGDFRKRPDAD